MTRAPHVLIFSAHPFAGAIAGRKVDAPLPPGEGLPAILCDPEVADEVQAFADERSREAVRRRNPAGQDELLGWGEEESAPPGLIREAVRIRSKTTDYYGHCWTLLPASTVAVGPPVSRRPPHRSQRAGLSHWAPASGRNAQAVFWIGVHDAQGGHPTARQAVIEPFPVAVTLVTATAQALPPVAQGGAGEALSLRFFSGIIPITPAHQRPCGSDQHCKG